MRAWAVAAVLVAASCNSQRDASNMSPGSTASSPKEECERLLGAAVPFAMDMLTKAGEFYPFGAAMTPAGEVVMVASTQDEEHPASTAVLERLTADLREAAGAGRYNAVALAADVRVSSPSSDYRDAIRVALEHRSGYSVYVFVPYRLDAPGQVRTGAPFASERKKEVFPSVP